VRAQISLQPQSSPPVLCPDLSLHHLHQLHLPSSIPDLTAAAFFDAHKSQLRPGPVSTTLRAPLGQTAESPTLAPHDGSVERSVNLTTCFSTVSCVRLVFYYLDHRRHSGAGILTATTCSPPQLTLRPPDDACCLGRYEQQTHAAVPIAPRQYDGPAAACSPDALARRMLERPRAAPTPSSPGR
jgi:hypothetical protein